MGLVIRHIRADGTSIYRLQKEAGAHEILQDLRCGRRWMRSIGKIGLQQSRYKAAKRYPTQQAWER
ncbi:hypothetical protein Acsp04_61220 [Actinomadura sp. NBRC 104425]|nr:hypothetical protein Acsp04_61220 [Actinomadura sp. NBRC 104425]